MNVLNKTDMTRRWCRTRGGADAKEGLIVVSNPIRLWDTDIVIYRGSRVEFESFTSRYDACQMHRNIINGRTYPFAHRSKGAAIHSAIQIINQQLNRL